MCFNQQQVHNALWNNPYVCTPSCVSDTHTSRLCIPSRYDAVDSYLLTEHGTLVQRCRCSHGLGHLIHFTNMQAKQPSHISFVRYLCYERILPNTLFTYTAAKYLAERISIFLLHFQNVIKHIK